jgi:hypothetical protein
VEYFVHGFTTAWYVLCMSTTSLAGPQVISRERAESILQPYIDILNECIDEGWNAWTTEYSNKFHLLDARARAAIVYCEIAYRARQRFASLEGVKVVPRRGTLTIFIGDEITLRFKKIRKTGRCSNIMTRTQALFLAQMQFPGMLDGTMVHAGYQLDDLQLDVIRKAVVCQLDKRVLWQIDLEGPMAEVVPVPSGTPQTPTSTPRFIPKKGLAVLPPNEAQG